MNNPDLAQHDIERMLKRSQQIPKADDVNSMTDYVNQPPHYLDGTIECIDAIVAVFGLEDTQKYAEIAAFKYLWRMNKKNKTPDEDKHKAIWYLRFSMGDDPRSNDGV